MKQEQLISLLQQPAPITTDQTTALQELLKEHPYFQVARALLLKGLKNQSSLHYNKELKITAAHSLDRGVLFDYISSKEFNQNAVSNRIKQHVQKQQAQDEPADSKTSDILSLDDALRVKLKETRQGSDANLLSPLVPGHKPHPEKEPTENTAPTPAESSTKMQQRSPISTSANASKSTTLPVSNEAQSKEEDLTEDKLDSESLNLGEPLTFAKEESHSFSEWLRLTQVKAINKEEEVTDKPETKSRKFKLIDQFISRSPRITPSKTPPKPNLIDTEQSAPEALMTETLARVYLEQKNYKKAIQAYKILILKNPEKSGFFADQIRAITKLQEQNS